MKIKGSVLCVLLAAAFAVTGCSKSEEKAAAPAKTPPAAATASKPAVAVPASKPVPQPVVEEKAEAALEMAVEVVEQVKEKAESMAREYGKQAAEEAVQTVKEKVPEQYQQVVETVKEMGAAKLGAPPPASATDVKESMSAVEEKAAMTPPVPPEPQTIEELARK